MRGVYLVLGAVAAFFLLRRVPGLLPVSLGGAYLPGFGPSKQEGSEEKAKALVQTAILNPPGAAVAIGTDIVEHPDKYAGAYARSFEALPHIFGGGSKIGIAERLRKTLGVIGPSGFTETP